MSIRIGFVGCGGMASGHMNNLSQMEGVELVAFCDVDSARAENSAHRFGGRAYTDHRVMLEKEDLDALYVVVPPFAHTDAEILAAQKGCGIFVEKPVAINLEKALEIQEAIEKSGVVNSVGYHWRYMEVTDLAKQYLNGKTIGMVLGYWMGGLPGAPWWRRMDGSGGQFVEQTTHIFDLARYLVGEIIEVSAYTALRALQEVESLDVPDVGSANLRFANGAIGTIHNTCLLKVGYHTGLSIITPDLIVELMGGLRLIEPGKRTEISNRNNAYRVEDEIFIEAVRTKDMSKVRSPYADAVRSLAVTLAANQSAEAGGKPIPIRL